ncbi:MAG: hypothetical protein ACREXT_16340, partial [Gammaproteobacteria bacterium]
ERYVARHYFAGSRDERRTGDPATVWRFSFEVPGEYRTFVIIERSVISRGLPVPLVCCRLAWMLCNFELI